jgi:predicted XRE-type DNA-binding protein
MMEVNRPRVSRMHDGKILIEEAARVVDFLVDKG